MCLRMGKKTDDEEPGISRGPPTPSSSPAAKDSQNPIVGDDPESLEPELPWPSKRWGVSLAGKGTTGTSSLSKGATTDTSKGDGSVSTKGSTGQGTPGTSLSSKGGTMDMSNGDTAASRKGGTAKGSKDSTGSSGGSLTDSTRRPWGEL